MSNELVLASMFALTPDERARIEGIDPRVRLIEAPWSTRPDGVVPESTLDDSGLRKAIWPAHVLFGNRFPAWVPDGTPELKWVQFSLAGMERFVGGPIWQSDAILTNGTGIQAPMIAEWAIAMVHVFAKQVPRLMEDQRARQWGKIGWRYRPIEGATLAVVGLGHIGGEVARRGKALGMRVIATRRGARSRRLACDGVDELYPPTDMPELLGRADYVVLAVPHTKETDGWFGRECLAAMRPGSTLINVCRGAVVDEAALTEALQSGHLGGAALDVFVEEPLPAESPLWGMPNVLVSPHRSGSIDGTMRLALDLLCENLDRFLAGRSLLNVVDREKGY